MSIEKVNLLLLINSDNAFLENYLQKKAYYINDKEIMKYTSHAKTIIDTASYIENSKKIIKNEIKNKNNFKFIIQKENKITLGEINLQNIDWINRTAEIIFMIWEKGFAADAGKQVIEHAFNRLNLNKIWLGTPACHIAMIKVAEKIGMQKEAELKKGFYLDGKYYDVYRYSIFQEDYYK